MPEIDPVVLRLHADVNGYLSHMQSATSKVEGLLDQQEKAARNLEREMKRSSAAISGHLRALAGTLATYFTGREIIAMGDSWSDLQSQVGVAIKDMERAPEIMGRLAEAARASYSPLEQTATQFARNSRTIGEMGYNTEAALKFTEALNNALVATATRGDRARQVQDSLSKAIATGNLEAEGLENILAHGGAVAEVLARELGATTNQLYQLRKEGKITGEVIVRSLINNFDELRAQAEEMPATVSDGFVLLRNQLLRYIGETDKALGATERMAQALISMSENLDKIIPALAVIAAAIGVRYTAALVAAGGATLAKAAADVRATQTAAALAAMQARLNPLLLGTAASANAAAASVTRLSVAMGLAARGGGALLGILGGPLGVAALALGAALYIVVDAARDAAGELDELTESAKDAEAKADDLEKRLRDAGVKIDDAGNKAARSAGKMDTFTRAMFEAAKQAEQLASKLQLAEFAKIETRRQELRRTLENKQSPQIIASPTGDIAILPPATEGAGNQKIINAIERELAALDRQEKNLRAAVKAGIDLTDTPSTVEAPSSAGKPEKPKKDRKSSGPSEDDIERRFNAERRSLMASYNSSLASMAGSAAERAEYELRNVELARLSTRAAIESEKNYSKAQKNQLLAQLEEVAEQERRAVVFQQRRQEEEEAQRLADERFRSEADALRLQYDLTDTQTERKRIALEMLDLENRYQQSLLEAIIASETATKAEKERARFALETLNRLAAVDRERTARRNETEVERYVRHLNRSSEQINEAIDGIKIDGLEALNDGLVDAMRGVKSLGDVFRNVADQIIADLLRIAIQQAVIQPLANSIFGGLGGLFGGGPSTFSSIFSPGTGLGNITGRRASGGPVSAGGTYLVGERGPELLRMGNTSGFIVPNHALRAGAQQGGGVAVVRLELTSDLDSRIVSVAGPIAVEVTRANAPAIADAGAAKAMRALQRPRM